MAVQDIHSTSYEEEHMSRFPGRAVVFTVGAITGTALAAAVLVVRDTLRALGVTFHPYSGEVVVPPAYTSDETYFESSMPDVVTWFYHKGIRITISRVSDGPYANLALYVEGLRPQSELSEFIVDKSGGRYQFSAASAFERGTFEYSKASVVFGGVVREQRELAQNGILQPSLAASWLAEYLKSLDTASLLRIMSPYRLPKDGLHIEQSVQGHLVRFKTVDELTIGVMGCKLTAELAQKFQMLMGDHFLLQTKSNPDLPYPLVVVPNIERTLMWQHDAPRLDEVVAILSALLDEQPELLVSM